MAPPDEVGSSMKPQVMHSAPSRPTRARSAPQNKGHRPSRGSQADPGSSRFPTGSAGPPDLFTPGSPLRASPDGDLGEVSRLQEAGAPNRIDNEKLVDETAGLTKILPPAAERWPAPKGGRQGSGSPEQGRGKKWLTSSPAAPKKRAPPNGNGWRRRDESRPGPRQRSPLSEQPLGL
jgi:hypothetical protein